jgi:methylamine---glutamate N-methyltransferase subunit A
MCGIAGIIHRAGEAPIGDELTRMLQALRHRGPDSTGFALYGSPRDTYVMRLVLAEPNEPRGLDWDARLERGRKQVEARLAKVGAHVDRMESETDYSYRAEFSFDGDLQPLVDYIEDVPGCEVLSIGHALEIVKDLGDAESVAEQYRLGGFRGTHGIGHVRMATESDVDISGAHPYWAYPFADLAVVHNGQLTNYHMWRRRLERTGHRFASECDSEIIAVYLAVMMERGVDLEIAMKQSMEDFDGVFTYLVVTEDALGVAKDVMAAKPLVVYESDDVVAVASEEVAIRAVMREEIDTHDPYEGEVLVWRSR